MKSHSSTSGLLVCHSCRLEPPAYYVAFLSPVLLVIVVNSIVLAKSVWTLCTGVTSVGRKGANTKVKGILGLTFLLGVTWILGIPMMDEARLPFQYIFAILNTVQGVAVLVFQFALNKPTRKLWRDSFQSNWSSLKTLLRRKVRRPAPTAHSSRSSKMEDEHVLTSGAAKSQETVLCHSDQITTDMAKLSSEIS